MKEIVKAHAEALFSLGLAENLEKEFFNELKEIEKVLDDNAEFVTFLTSPSIPLAKRTEVIETLFGENAHEFVVSFLKLLCEKKRINSLKDCIFEYNLLLNMRASIITAKVTSAVKLTKKQQDDLRAKLKKKYGKTVELKCFIDETLLGGVIVEIDGKITDGSLRQKLQDIKEVLSK